MKIRLLFPLLTLLTSGAFAQALTIPWSGYAHDAQHAATSATQAQPLHNIHWSVSIDRNQQFTNGDLFIHYGSPSITAANTVLVPVKTGLTDSFQVEARSGSTGSLLYTLPTDYSLPPHDWTPPYSGTLSLGTRYYYPGAGGTVYYRDSVNSPTGPNGQAGATGQFAFYGNSVYAAATATFNSNVKISTPLVADRFGNIFFGFMVLGPNPANLSSGIARISYNGTGTWVRAATMAGDNAITQVALNCAPALSNDQRTLYAAVSTNFSLGSGYLTAIDSTTLAPVSSVPLLDPRGGSATILGDSSAAPLVGPDGDVYFGVLEANCCASHNDRGWMLHFNASLSQAKMPGSFGWDDTASIVPSSLVPSYQGSSSYLLLTKYNNYVGIGTGDGVNKVAILDPNAAMQDPYSAVQVMREVISVKGPTPEPGTGFPNAVREWCINSAAVDPLTKSAIVNSEDGFVYRWDFTTNTLSEVKQLTDGIGEAYTPTLIGPDGTAYAINDAVLFAIGN